MRNSRQPQPLESKSVGTSQSPKRIEWVVGAASAALIAAMIGFILADALRDAGVPAILVARVDGVTHAPGGFRVDLEINNDGDLTAAAVEIEAELRAEAGVAERARVTLDYAPAHSSTKGHLLFSLDPRAHDLVVAVKGFAEP